MLWLSRGVSESRQPVRAPAMDSTAAAAAPAGGDGGGGDSGTGGGIAAGLRQRMKLGMFPRNSEDREALRRDGLTLFSKLIRTKNIESMQGDPLQAAGKPKPPADGKGGKTKLNKCLSTLDLTSLGVGSCVGTGMYLVAGMVAKNVAGPGVIFSFIIAAVASIFSGACYAEFGVRVPHTTGSAYMYSYVTVGEFIAFVIGWNMVLEYLIGTSACACALSACFDSLADGAISESVAGAVGTILGRPPDFLAFGITILMTFIMAAGVRKSLAFNNVLNALNLAVWVFVMTAGLFYVDSRNWSEHKGFLPYGWSGVLTGAATCFYAFIGFDIIATTGEEATNPKRSIPLAIISSLVVILTAYVTSSMMLTLIVPYEDVDADSALVEMFGFVGAYKCKYVVAIGALAGLTVSMFGSMFPMPRIVYAMAKDGLIFRILGQVWPLTGTPALATFISGLAAAFAALLIQLEVLVEMMSIGTLLAYTLVSTCVLILRYQPHTTNLVELLPESLRTPIRGSPTKEHVAQMANGAAAGAGPMYGDQLRPDDLRDALGRQMVGQPDYANANNRVTVRRVTRGSPDSDDTYPDEGMGAMLSGASPIVGVGVSLEGDNAAADEYLVSDRSENKFYGSLPASSSGGGAGGLGSVAGGRLGGFFSSVARKLDELTYLCPGIFPWVDRGPATEESGLYVMRLVGILYLFIFCFDIVVVCGVSALESGEGAARGATIFFLVFFLTGIFVILLLISRKPQNRKTLLFMTPGLPFVPAIAVIVNIYLIFKLSILTLVRFTLWMALGLGMYFYYGIKHSTLEEEDGQNIELTVTTGDDGTGAAVGVKAPATTTGADAAGQAYGVSGGSYTMQTGGVAETTAVGSTSNQFEYDYTNYPSWDD
ncbi:probable cationic amino acid transporter [Ischnura elegans]|uniref:probable cationic amino acid transporter n=1 Tax=Ischnura elegans TaxID=197161 RepID=UPI001ED8BF28|nr:probable cationic amino acid transporter [Ischnura elegans]